MICTATDKCVKCEQHGHFFTDCPQYKKEKMSRNESDNSLENEPLSDATTISEDSGDSGDSEQSEEEESLSDATTITEESITEESPLTRSKKRKLEECEEKNKKQKQKKTKN